MKFRYNFKFITKKRQVTLLYDACPQHKKSTYRAARWACGWVCVGCFVWCL